ncbi:MAG: hypothetical protein EBS05_07140 [Proteobacteria bacterium]|nr:hypothetical protein [Pseudomonadota bacterium]
MKYQKLMGLSSALALSAISLGAQEANPIELKKQLEELLRVQKQQSEQIESLRKQIDVLKGAPATPGAKTATTEPKIEALQQRVDALTETSKKSFASQFNPAIGFVGETVFGYRSTGSDKNGGNRPGGFDANLRSGELTLQAAVDPFAKGYLVLNGSADSKGEATLGIEEAALVTTSLPGNLTVRAGRFFADFGRLTFRHDHELPFVNRPLVLDQFIGGESRSDGLEASWLLPTSHYINFTAGVGTQLGGALPNAGTFRAANELTFWTHLSSFWELTPNLTLEGGLSGLINDRADDLGGALVQADGSTLTERRRKVAGLDLTLRYQPLDAAAYRGVEWGTELLFNQGDYTFDPNGSLNPANPGGAVFSGDESRGHVHSLGLYSYLATKLNREWTAGFLFDWVQNLPGVATGTAANTDTFCYSPYLTWKPSETHMLRLQYSYTAERPASGRADDHAVYLQWTYVIGSHSHGFRDR